MMSIFEKIEYRDNIHVNVRIQDIDDYPWRYHKDITIIFVLDGEVGLKLSYSNYKLAKGDIHIIHPEDVYGFKKLSSSNKVLLMHFDVEYFKKEYPHLDMQVFTTKLTANPAKYNEQKLLRQKLLSIVFNYAKADSFYVKGKGSIEEEIDGEATKILHILYEHFHSFSLNQDRREFEHKKSHDAMQSDRISQIVSHIYENYDSKLSLAEIARDLNLNKYYMSHLFKKYAGENFRVFVSMVRVEISESMLLETDDYISEIAANVGFSNTKYFIDNFRIWFGCSPKEYRAIFRDETIIKKETRAKEYDSRKYGEIIEKYAYELGADQRHPKELKKILEDIGDILEIEVILKAGDCTYKLKVDTENISNISIIPHNIT